MELDTPAKTSLVDIAGATHIMASLIITIHLILSNAYHLSISVHYG